MAVTGSATAGADTLVGDAADDVIRGLKGNDRLLGGGGRDTIWGDDGADTIDGGSGTDTAAWLGRSSAFQITQLANGNWQVKDASSKNGPTDLLIGVERLQFDDRIILLSPDIAPVALADTAAMVEDGAPVTIDVLANDSDGDRDALTLSAIIGVAGGTASIVNGRIVFTAAANFNGTATITYAVTESLGTLPAYNTAGTLVSPATAQGTVTIAVAAVNDAPTAPATRSVSATEDTAITVAIGAADLDGDALAYATKATAQPAKGVVAYANGGFTYTPFANANGSDAFTVVISDGKGGTTEQAVTVSIAAVNDAPTAPATRSVTTNEDTATARIAIGASDVDGDALTYATKAGAQPTKGTVAYSNGGFTYTPFANANGSDAFTIVISDGKGGTTEQRVFVGITPMNDAPTGQPTISGTPKVGQTLTVGTAGLTDADGLGSMTYAWQVQDGALWTTIGTGATHTIAAAELGKALRVLASYTDGGGTAESVASAATDPVRDGLQAVDSVVIAGEQYDGANPAYALALQLGSAGGFGATTYVVTQNPEVGGGPLVPWTDASGYIGVNVGTGPAGTTAATFVALDQAGDTASGTLTLQRVAAELPGFSLAGGAGDDIVLLPGGGGTLSTGGGNDQVFAEGIGGDVLLLDSGGESLTLRLAGTTGGLDLRSDASVVRLSIDGMQGALSVSGAAVIGYSEISFVTGDLRLSKVQSVYADRIDGLAWMTLVQGGTATVDYVSGNVWLTGTGGYKSAAHVAGSAVLEGGGTLTVQDVGLTASLMGAGGDDLLRADRVAGGAWLDGGAGNDLLQGGGAAAASGGINSFEGFVLRSGQVTFDVIAGFDGVAGGSGDQIVMVGYGQGSVVLEATATEQIYTTIVYDPRTRTETYGPMVDYVSQKVWRIVGTDDRFITNSNTWMTSDQDAATGVWTRTWHVDSDNFDPLADMLWY
ncbi:tandem-95 repeat protein [Falsiroseomonas sp. HW251]|uniref:beta strand repeat-containing protein n=1 Tax=Falsiroseomonas sp. HW251 TaxID=3390998 RepID=UPI003D31890C